jgi:menaquinone-dependent protoporphyrinogen oxidase
MRVLIAYGSRYGSTEEIAHRLAGFLGEEGMEATVLDVKRERRWPSLEGYDGVMVGSSVKISKWMREPLEFLRRKRGELEGKRVALFVSCMSVLTDPENARVELLEKVMGKAGVEADMYMAFGPVMDLGPGSRIGFLEKRIAGSAMREWSKEQGMEFDAKGRNDFRDWDKIRDFARKFANSLRE